MTHLIRSAACAALLAAALSLAGCGHLYPAAGSLPSEEVLASSGAPTAAPPREALVGEWVEPVPGMPRLEQGYALKADGTASSIGMATLVAKRWTLSGDVFTLFGDSIGNGITIPFEMQFLVIEASPDRLILRQGAFEHRFSRRR